ncbi:hydroxyacid dehydrogenase [Candidatus Bathyarchaeota archaeon]|nr:hydroxyacid dehydrogenase [Candidatus Bathyarchaeota archaeon]
MPEALALLRSKAEVRLNPYGRVLREEELIEELRDVDAVLAGGDSFSAKVISSARNLKIIARDGVGLDRVDLAAATKAGIVVTIAPTVCESVADLTFGLILCVMRRILIADRSVRSQEWNLRRKFVGRDVHGATLGIIGLGRVGSGVAKRARGFRMRVLGYDPYVKPERIRELGVEPSDLDALLRESDVVTIHTPLTEETRGLIGSREIGLMKDGSYLINTARGAIVDEKALYEALRIGKLAGAGLDVLTVEPPTPENPLLNLENVVLTPHIGNDTVEAFRRLSLQAAEDIIRVLDGEPPLNPVNPEALARRKF